MMSSVCMKLGLLLLVLEGEEIACAQADFLFSFFFFAIFLALFLIWVVFMWIGILSSNPGGKRGPEHEDEPKEEIDAELGLFERIRGSNLLVICIGLGGWFFFGDMMI